MKLKVVRDDLEKEESKEVELEKDARVDDLLETLELEPQEVLVSRDGKILTGKHTLQDGDTLKVMDVIAGG
ncbi:MAG: MoaD/ThiS family protein [Candidatus Nanohaloarchaea archaeon]